jgi:hypothetical protein
MFTYVVENSSRKPSSSSFCTTVYENQPFFAPGRVCVHLQRFWNGGSTMLYGWRLRLYVAILATRDLLRAMHVGYVFATGDTYFPTGTGRCSDYTSNTLGATGYSQVFLYMFFLLDLKGGEEGECGRLD